MHQEQNSASKTIIFYDGSCLMCSRLIHFIYKKDTQKVIFFSDLHSQTAQQLGIKNDDSFMLWHKHQFYSKSTAALELMALLNYPKLLVWCLEFIPKPIRDFCYECVAKYRKSFQKTTTCSLNPKLKAQILS